MYKRPTLRNLGLTDFWCSSTFLFSFVLSFYCNVVW